MGRPVRIGNCSGFFGDRAGALAAMAAEPGVDVITGDYLAEVTMLVLAKSRLKDRDGGYAASFLRHLEPAVASIAERGIKVVVNAGGLNPVGLAAAVGKLVAEAGVDLTVAVVDGDDLSGELTALAAAGHELPHLRTGAPLASWGHQPLTANAYLGAWGIVRALDAGADVVVTGRVTDASLVVGPAAWWHGWSRMDLDELAGAVVAGHLIECGTQVTGGNYSGFADLGAGAMKGSPAFPIAEVAGDGSSVITKAGGGGAVTVGTVTAQLLYEIGGPDYLNPDVVARFDTVALEPVGDDRVLVRGVRGAPPPATTKVAVTALGGHRNQFTTVVTGLDVEAKVAWFEAAVRNAVEAIGGIDEVTFERIGTVADDPPDQGSASMLVRTTVSGAEASVGRPFGAAIIELALANIPGFYGLGLPGPASSFGTYWPALIDQHAVPHRVTLPDGTTEPIPPPDPPDRPPPPFEGSRARKTVKDRTQRENGAVAALPDRPPPPFESSGARKTVKNRTQKGNGAVGGPEIGRRGPLGLVADARSGDKGGDANVGVWVRSPEHWPWLRDTLTVDQLRVLVPETAGLDVDRYELPNVLALNFVVHELLGEGATANTRVDSQAKALGEYLRARHVDLPPGDVDP